MSTVTEIKLAVGQLPPRKQRVLARWLQAQVNDRPSDEDMMEIAAAGARVLDQRKAAGAPGFAQKPGHAFRVEIRQRRVPAGGGVERAETDQFAILQITDQGGIDSADQLSHGDETAADQFVARLPDQGAHLAVPGGIVRAFHKDQRGFFGRRATY